MNLSLSQILSWSKAPRLCGLLLFSLLWAYVHLLSAQVPGKQDPQLLEEINALEYDLSKLKMMLDESSKYQSLLNNKTLDRDIKKEGLEQLKATLADRTKQLKALQAQKNAILNGGLSSRCTFRVHLGAYQELDLSQYSHLMPYFRVDQQDGGIQVFSIGVFASYFEAKNLSEFLNSQGSATYVIGFLDNVQVPDLRDITDCTGF